MLAEHVQRGTPLPAVPATSVLPAATPRSRRRRAPAPDPARLVGPLPDRRRLAAGEHAPHGGQRHRRDGAGPGRLGGQRQRGRLQRLPGPLQVKLGTQAATLLAPRALHARHRKARPAAAPRARTAQEPAARQPGRHARGSFGQFVYNVAGLAPLVSGPPPTATPRRNPSARAAPLVNTSAGIVFPSRPRHQHQGGGGCRRVISALADAAPSEQLGMLDKPAEGKRVATLHARWDAPTRLPRRWLWIAREASFAALLERAWPKRRRRCCCCAYARRRPPETETRRHLPNATDARAAACPANANLAYVATRCIADRARRTAPSPTASRATQHGWYAYAASYVAAGKHQWAPTIAAAELARRKVPSLANVIARWTSRACAAPPDRCGHDGRWRSRRRRCAKQLTLESGQGIKAPAWRLFGLARGRIDNAVKPGAEPAAGAGAPDPPGRGLASAPPPALVARCAGAAGG